MFNQEAQSVLVFRKWGRKAFSLFLTLHRQVVISVLAVVYFLSTPAISLATVQDSTETNKMEYDLDEIEVSAQRTPAVYSQVARILSVIERDEIEAAPAQSVQDLLEYIAGVDVRQRGTEGVQADIGIRGGTFDQTLILLNGINITDPQTGHHNLDLPVSLSQIERIEVLEGPAARVYGPNAFSGAINIVTRNNPGNRAEVAFSSGSFGYLEGNASAGFKTGHVQHLLAVNGKQSEGYTDNTDFEKLNAYYQNRLTTRAGKLDYQLGLTRKGFGANSFYTPKFPNQYEATKTLFTSLRWKGEGTWHLTPAVYYRRHQDRFELFRNNPASWYQSHNYHLTQTYGANLNSWVKWAAGKTALGFEYRGEHIYSNVLGTEMSKPKDVPGEDAQFIKSAQRDIWSAFVEHAYYYDDLTISAGLMANTISGSGLGVNVFPGIDVSYVVYDQLKLYASYNTSLRMPTYTDLFYDGPTNIGNPDLKPEKSATIEGGLKLGGYWLRGHAVAFYRKGDDMIDWVKEEGQEQWQPRNLTRIYNFGTEMQVQAALQKKLGKFAPNLSASYLYNNLSKEDNEMLISHYVLDNLKHKLLLSADQYLAKGVSLSLKAVYQDRNGSYTKYENSSEVGEVPYDPFWLFDAKLSYSRNAFTAFASVNNLFDTTYNDIGNVIQPGRWMKVGLRYQIDFQ